MQAALQHDKKQGNTCGKQRLKTKRGRTIKPFSCLEKLQRTAALERIKRMTLSAKSSTRMFAARNFQRLTCQS
jgi:hypothetical protein